MKQEQKQNKTKTIWYKDQISKQNTTDNSLKLTEEKKNKLTAERK